VQKTLGSLLDPRDNSLNLIRLVLAVAVIVAHSTPLGGFGDAPRLGGMNLGEWAVAGFFALSGWLITASRLSSTLREFVRRRFVRIYPGFLVSLLFVAFVAAPLSALSRGAYTWGAGLEYARNNIFVAITQEGIDGTLVGAPWSDVWNGSVWTLFYELLCYCAIALVVWLTPRASVPMVLLGFWVGVTCIEASAWFTTGMDGNPLARLLAFFVSGALLYAYRDKVPVSAAWVAGAVVAAVGGIFLDASWALAGLPVAYLVMCAGATRRVHLARVHDLSYGMYVYAWPVQHLLREAGVAQWGVVVFAIASIACTAPLAAASWFLVERPAMRLRGKRAARPAPQAVAALTG